MMPEPKKLRRLQKEPELQWFCY